MNPRALVIAFVVVVVVVVGCKSKDQEQKERDALKAEVKGEIESAQKLKDEVAAVDAAKAKLDEATAKAAAKEAARRDVVEHPENHLEVKALQSFDKGIVNSYRSVQSITVLNNSKYPVDQLQANVEWTSANGALLGSTPLTLSGSIAAGDTKTFSIATHTLTSGTLQGQGVHYKVKWSHVVLVGNGN